VVRLDRSNENGIKNYTECQVFIFIALPFLAKLTFSGRLLMRKYDSTLNWLGF
jgi:hypothetical protein